MRSQTFPFKIDFFTRPNSFPVINICFVSFFTYAGSNSPRGVTLYMMFLSFFRIFIILSPSISICIGFKLPATSKFCCARIIID